MTNAAVTATHLIHPTVHAVADSGNVIDLTVWSTHVNITTWAGAERVQEWTRNIPATTPTEREAACKEASRILNLFNTYGGPRGVEQRRNQLAIQRTPVAARQARSRTPWIYDTQIETLDAEMAALEDLTTRALRPQLVAAVTAHLTKAA
jgi:hypothetical protein